MPSTLAHPGVRFATALSGFGSRPALVTGQAVVSYAELADRVAAVAAELGTQRRLVLIAGTNEVEPIVTYLAALAAGHPVILVPGDAPGNLAQLVAAYDPDVTCAGGRLREHRPGSAHDLHPELALLLSTSGSTGSPKLVRLSATNLESNARSIASYLSIRPTDVAATTLPMHYCYGLSVVNSHLLSGASLLLTSLSVVDECFWDLFRDAGATTFAGVPYTFDLLDRARFAERDLPSLRYVTQAGGRMSPDAVTRYAELGRRRGWDLYVMYGQTEATARMAYLPPDRALSSPSAIGVPIPGGSFSLEPLPEMPLARADRAGRADVGELVYSGDNVMLGYATSPEDLARGREVDSLRTGDVARRTPDGLYEVIGRRNRFAKLFGLRIDLDQAERVLAAHDVTGYCADGDDRLVVAVDSSARPVPVDDVHELAKEHLGLPASAVQVVAMTEVPRLPSGKPDYRAIASTAAAEAVAATPPSASRSSEELKDLYREVLRRPDVRDNDSFVSLDGDSLSYVEMSIRLEEALGHLPPGWHVTPIEGLVPAAPTRRSRLRSIEGNVALRAVAIVLIVGSHANLFWLLGGAHVLLGLAGFNFGRFQMTDVSGGERVRRLVASTARIAVPSAVWIAAAAAFSGYTWQNALLLNGVLGPQDWSEPQWHYWFIEALVYTLLALTVLTALPVVARAARRWPFGLPMALVGLGLLTRYGVVDPIGGDVIHRAHVIFWLFALGWATVKAGSHWHRLLVSAVVAATVPGFFDDPVRELVVVAGMLALVWVRTVRVPSALARIMGVLASASLYIYLAHWQVYPHLEDHYPVLATVLSLAAGIALWRVVGWVSPYAESHLAIRRPRRRTTAETRRLVRSSEK